MNKDTETTIIRVITRLSLLLCHAVQLGKVKVGQDDMRAVNLGLGSTHRMIEYCAMAGLGELVDNDDMRSLLELEHSDSKYIVLDIAGSTARVENIVEL